MNTKRPDDTPTRDKILLDLWCRHGCPKKLTIHVKSTGETVTLIDGSPVTDNAEKNPALIRYFKAENRKRRIPMHVTDNPKIGHLCRGCDRPFHSARRDAKYCSARCRQSIVRKLMAERKRLEAAELLANMRPAM